MAETTIQGQTFATRDILATEALRLFKRFGRVAGPAIGGVVRALASAKEDEASSNAALFEAVTSIMEADDDEFVAVAKALCETCQVEDGGAYRNVMFDTDLTGRLGLLLPLIAFAVREQLGDLFTDVPSLMGAARAKG